MPTVRSFQIRMPDSEVDDMRRRLRETRWPPTEGEGWEAGTDAGFLRELCRYGAEEFDWRAQESRLNRFPQFIAHLDASDVHFVHAKAAGGDGIPILLGHGWPGTFAEYLPVIPLLTDPSAHGLGGPAFDVVVPSLPGYGFSERPAGRSWDYAETARLWHALMQQLGYARFAVGGTDFGSGVATMMAVQYPERVIGLHLSTLELDPVVGPDDQLTAAETEYTERAARWWHEEGGYLAIQSTKPGTLAVGLTDSPAGLAAWIAEKWIGWSDQTVPLDERVDRDDLLTTISLYWLTRTIGTSILDYRDNRRHPPGLENIRVPVPTRFAAFADPAGDPPDEWVKRLYPHVEVMRMPRGGHFAAIEQPQLLAADIVRFLRER